MSNKVQVTSHKLKLRLLKEKILNHECFVCKNTHWNNAVIPLELHHKDGNTKNNNLELLCPNCHSQTDNYRGKKKRKTVWIKQPRKKNVIEQYCYCGKRLRRLKAQYCSKTCKNKDMLTNNKPTKEALIQEISNSTITLVAKKYNVSRTTINRWLKE